MCFGKYSKDLFANSTDKFKIIIKLLNTQIDIKNIECISGHLVQNILIKLFQYYTNIFLQRMAEFKSDFRSGKNIRKLLVFNPDHEEPLEDLEF